MTFPTHGPEFHERTVWMASCRAATTAAITIASDLNAGDTIDGVTLAAGDRVLVKDQAAPEENGVYVAGASPARPADFTLALSIMGAAVVIVREGTANAATAWLTATALPFTIDTDPLTFTGFGTGGGGGTPDLATVLAAGNDVGGSPFTIVQDDPSYTRATQLFLGSDARLKGASAGSGTGGGDVELDAGAGDDDGVDKATGANAYLEAGHSAGLGGSAYYSGGNAKAGTNTDGGDVWLYGGNGDGTGRHGLIILDSLPTSDPGVSQALWNDSGVIKISP